MRNLMKVAIVGIFTLMLAGLSTGASAHRRLYPVTRCGPDMAYLCRIHGYFDAAPFHYNAAIYPGCIKTVVVQTPYGVRRRPTIVCGAPDREMIWWW